MEASKWRRFINWLIDNVLVLAVLAVIVRLLASPDTTKLMLRLMSVGLLFVYYTLTEYFFQRSLGKVFTRTIVVDSQDERPTLPVILLRTLCRFIPLEPISLLFNRTRALHDLLSRTKVIFVNY